MSVLVDISHTICRRVVRAHLKLNEEVSYCANWQHQDLLGQASHEDEGGCQPIEYVEQTSDEEHERICNVRKHCYSLREAFHIGRVVLMDAHSRPLMAVAAISLLFKQTLMVA